MKNFAHIFYLPYNKLLRHQALLPVTRFHITNEDVKTDIHFTASSSVPLYPLEDFKALHKYCIIIIINLGKSAPER